MGCNAPKFKKDVKREREREKTKGMENIHHSPLLWHLNSLICPFLHRNFQANTSVIVSSSKSGLWEKFIPPLLYSPILNKM